MLFVSKQKQIESQLSQYCRTVADCVEAFHRALKSYAQNADRNQLTRDYQTVHQAESRADDLRREIEVLMYSKSIFPESRGDILNLLESVDRVPNQAEKIVQMLLTRRIILPANLTDSILQLADVSLRCVKALLEGVEKLFTDFTNATAAVGKVDALESQSDQLQFQLYDAIFAGDKDGYEKLLVADLIRSIASVCDRAENAGDRIRIVVAKRSI
jgi:uncharacterized protein